MYDLVKNGKVIESREFTDTPPILAEHKGKWLPRVIIENSYNPETQTVVLEKTITDTESRWEYVVSDIPADTLALAKAAANIATLNEDLSILVKDYSPLELITWSVQLSEATGYVADNNHPTPLIDAVILESGEDKLTFAQSILDKAALFAPAAGAAIGRKRSRQNS